MNGKASAQLQFPQKMTSKVGEMDHNIGKRKCVKRKMEESNLVLGKAVKLHEILDMEEATMVGHFASKKMSIKTLHKQNIENFRGILGYTSKCM
jgi:hypothetical protein